MTWDLLAAGAVVLLAIGWLLYRRANKKSAAGKNAQKGSYNCADGCDGCPMKPETGNCPSNGSDSTKKVEL